MITLIRRIVRPLERRGLLIADKDHPIWTGRSIPASIPPAGGFVAILLALRECARVFDQSYTIGITHSMLRSAMARHYKMGLNRDQAMLLPPGVDDYVGEDNPVRVMDAYVEQLDLQRLGFVHADGELTAGQPAYPPGALLKLYLYGYLMRVCSSRRLEAECQRNLEVM